MEVLLYPVLFIIFLLALYITVRVVSRAIVVSLKEGINEFKQKTRERNVGTGTKAKGEG